MNLSSGHFLVFPLPLGHELSAFPPPSGTVSLLSYTKFGKRFVIVPRFLGTPIEFRKMDPRKLNFWVFLVYIRFLVNKWIFFYHFTETGGAGGGII